MIKKHLRKVLTTIGLDLTPNIKNDRLTEKIIVGHLHPSSNCIDVGAHKGEILDVILKCAPSGQHFAFEPIPSLYQELLKKYQGKAEVLPYALSEEVGTTQFNFVKNAPAYSGLRQRDYAIDNPQIETIEVKQEKLDNIVDAATAIDFIKIDVEGAEYKVLQGAKELLKRDNPMVLFEFGKGASDFYDVNAETIYHFFEKMGYKIWGLEAYINAKSPYTLGLLEKHYQDNTIYNFVALKQID